MDIVETPNGVDKAVIDLYGNPFYAELAQVVETLRHAPYWHEGEKAPSRLDRARELVRNSRVLLQDERLASVYGSTKAYDVTGFHCTCPQSQKGQSLWCVHSVAVKLARTLVEQASHTPAPVALGTLRPGTLPLPPTTVDARLAQPTPDLPLIAHREEGTAYHTSEGVPYTMDARLALGTMRDSTALAMHHTPQEDRMDDNEYIPEPDTDDAPVTVLEPPTPTAVPRPLPGPVLLPSLDAQSLKRSMQEWSAQRQVIKSFLQQELKEGIDFYRLQVRGKDANPTLSKAGAEKFLGLFQLQASFMPDIGTWEMLGKPNDLVSYVCTLMTRQGEVVGEGRGARSLKKDGGDANKAIKMAEKSALIDAVLRTGALSEVYTQDLESDEEPAKAAPPVKPNPLHPSAELRQRIWTRVKELAPEARTREAVEAFIKERTGMDLHPDLYEAILARMDGRA